MINKLIKEFYNKNGFVNFKFTSSIAQLVNNSNKFEIILTVSEGEKFNFGQLK
jgi:outer membrane protein insertion porin family